jgi:capsular polysaccharide biosynthesis protein
MEPRENNEEIEIDFKEIIFVLLRRIWLIALVGISVALIAFLLSKFFITPQYESTTKIYLMNKQDSQSTITYSDLQSGSQLTKDYMTLISSRPVTERVIAELGLDLTHEQLVQSISVNNPTDTRILEITVKYPDPFSAKKISDNVREASSEHITEVMNIEQVNLVEEANIPEGPVSPNVFRNMILGGVLGTLISAFIVVIIFILNDKIITPDDVEKYLGISVLSTIPIQESIIGTKKKKKKRKV